MEWACPQRQAHKGARRKGGSAEKVSEASESKEGTVASAKAFGGELWIHTVGQ